MIKVEDIATNNARNVRLETAMVMNHRKKRVESVKCDFRVDQAAWCEVGMIGRERDLGKKLEIVTLPRARS